MSFQRFEISKDIKEIRKDLIGLQETLKTYVNDTEIVLKEKIAELKTNQETILKTLETINKATITLDREITQIDTFLFKTINIKKLVEEVRGERPKLKYRSPESWLISRLNDIREEINEYGYKLSPK